MPEAWMRSFEAALAQGNVSRLRLLAREASAVDAVLGSWLVDEIANYNLNELQRKIEEKHG